MHSILRSFREVKAMKLGTTHLGSPEFYVLARGYDSVRNESAKRTKLLYNSLLDRTYDSYLEARRIIINRGRGRRADERYDWFSPTVRADATRILVRPDNLPPGIKITNEERDWKIDIEWDPKWDERKEKFTSLVKRKRLRWIEDSTFNVQHISPIGTIVRKRKSQAHKNIQNGLINSALYDIWGITLSNSIFCHTQSTEKWKNASITKRLDVDPGHLDQASISKLMRALLALETDYAKTLHGSCGLMSEEDVLIAINYQGATGILDDGNTLREYITQHPDWYNKGLQIIRLWSEGKTTDSYFTAYNSYNGLKMNRRLKSVLLGEN